MPHHVQREIRYNFEYERRVRACFIGAGGHAYRNVYPALRYAPVDLTAICDLDIDRAGKFAKLFGAERAYSDHREMLEKESPISPSSSPPITRMDGFKRSTSPWTHSPPARMSGWKSRQPQA